MDTSKLIAVAVAAALGGCGSASTQASAAAAQRSAAATAEVAAAGAAAASAGPDDATVRNFFEKPWADELGSSDTHSYQYHAIQHGSARKITIGEAVDMGVPQGKTVYPVRVSALRQFDANRWEIVRAFLFWKDDYGGWTGSTVPSADTKTQRVN